MGLNRNPDFNSNNYVIAIRFIVNSNSSSGNNNTKKGSGLPE